MKLRHEPSNFFFFILLLLFGALAIPWEFEDWFFHFLILVVVTCYFIVVLTWIFKMTSAVEYSVMCLLASCTSFLEKMSFQVQCSFLKSEFFCLSVVELKELYLGTRPFSGTWFANIFSLSMSYLLIHFVVSKVFKFYEVQLVLRMVWS